MLAKTIPFSGPDITEEDLKAVNEVIRSGWLSHGNYSERLEGLFCEFTGAKYATTVSNCTAGLHLSCLVAGLGAGDEAVIPAQTHTATAHAVEYTGAKAVFADVDPITGNILVEEIEKKITEATKVVIPVHMAGYPCNMQYITELCAKHDLVLIEDCAHAIGTKCHGKHAGNFGISGNFSFYPTKQITTGEGGVVISNDETFIQKVRKLKAFGIDTPPELRTKPGIYDVRTLGYNYRMTDFQAALGVGQIERYSNNLTARKSNGRKYTELLGGLNWVEFPKYNNNNSYFVFQLIIKKGVSRNLVLMKLKEKGIGVSVHYATPIPLMTYYKRKYEYQEEDFPNSVNYGKQIISLPVHSKLANGDIKYICSAIKEIV